MILGSGIDVVEVTRIERALERFGERFERRVFSRRERVACRRFQRPALHYALRFAAKEALMKAVGTGWSRGVRWIDIETRQASHGEAWSLTLHGRVAEITARTGRGRARTHLAVARCGELALASVLLEEGDG